MALQPYQILAQWADDGSYQGGQTLRRDDATGRIVGSLPIGADTDFPWSVLTDEINLAMAAANTALTAEVATLTAQLATAEQALTDAQAAKVADDAAIEQLQAQLAAATATAPAPRSMCFIAITSTRNCCNARCGWRQGNATSTACSPRTCSDTSTPANCVGMARSWKRSSVYSVTKALKPP